MAAISEKSKKAIYKHNNKYDIDQDVLLVAAHI